MSHYPSFINQPTSSADGGGDIDQGPRVLFNERVRRVTGGQGSWYESNTRFQICDSGMVGAAQSRGEMMAQ
ncbi:MAG: hypothetical protein CBD86_01900 [Gammaproteobacteria bacterium TMED226]|nr:MAG: hypothetical protein CBD86_03335 [Gammaproteobacteria bacterium TMED226]OUW88849.1 MAG: hypothetical protein CBD86_01900 [Gammaproteobacteria bacterium TMED226]